MAVTQGGIFISYRRQETRHLAGRLYDRLADDFGDGQVFIDVDTIDPGVDFAEEIFRAVGACRVLLAVIGPSWLTASDERGRRRLDDPEDIVRLEIEAALARSVRVIPILVDAAVMPARQDLPESLAGLARRHALPVRHESFRSDVRSLTAAIQRALEVTGPGAAEPAQDRAARASRLVDDAIRIARRITDESQRARALAEAAGALAATQPDRAAELLPEAEQIANSITSYDFLKGSALAEVAKAQAATDPDRAERIARSISYEPQKISALGNIARVLAATDPDRAERIANSIADPSWRSVALSFVAAALADTHPHSAVQLIVQAQHIAGTITDESSKAQTLADVARELAATHPDRAVQFLARAEHIASAGESPGGPVMCNIVGALAVTDSDRAERVATTITDEADKARALGYIAAALAVTDADRAERIASTIDDEWYKAWALSSTAVALATTDPGRAERIAATITGDSQKVWALIKIAAALSSVSR
jgi:TIR domain